MGLTGEQEVQPGCLDFISLSVSSLGAHKPRERREATAFPYRASCAHSVARRMLFSKEFVKFCISAPEKSLQASTQRTSMRPSFQRCNLSSNPARRVSLRLAFSSCLHELQVVHEGRTWETKTEASKHATPALWYQTQRSSSRWH